MKVNSTTPRAQGPKKVGNVIELFAGVGGFRIALEASGWNTVLGNQWEPSTKSQDAFDCYSAHFNGDGELSNEDIAVLVKELEAGTRKAPRADMIVGGFPCQDYSVAKSLNSAKGLEGKKGVLWWEIHSLVSRIKPTYVFLENVDRLLKSPSTQRGRDFAIMLRTLGDLGYLIEWRVINAAEVGFAQRRIRVYIVAKKVQKVGKWNPKTVLESTGIFARAFPARVMSDIQSVEIAPDPVEITKDFGKDLKNSPFQTAGVYVGGTAYTAKIELIDPPTPQTLGSILIPDSQVPAEYWIDEKKLQDWQYLKGAKSIERTHKASGHKFTYAEGKMAFPDSLDKPARTIVTGEGGSTPSRFKHIIKTEKGYRRLLPIELERLNGFPDDWTKQGISGKTISDIKRAFFMGNALVVGVVERIGAVIAEDFNKPK